jgi:transposase
MLHAGIDLHKRTIAIATVSPDGQPVQDRQLPTTRAAVRAYFEALPGPHRAVVESTSNWYWLRDLLVGSGVDLRIGHSKYIKAISDAKVKTDAVDAATLAQLLRSDLVSEAHMVSAEWREARDLLRARLQLVGQQVRRKNTVAGLLAQYNVTTPEALPPLVQLRTTMLAEQSALLGTQAKQLAAALNPLLIPTPDVQRLLWIPGTGRLVAFTILLEVDGIARISSARDFVSYCRLMPGAGNSGGKTRHERTKDGNKYLKIAFSHAAIRAIQYFPEIGAFYRALARRKPPIVARAVVAQELARIVYYVLTKREDFNGTFKGKALSQARPANWEPRSRSACSSAVLDWAASRRTPPTNLWDRPERS